MDRITRAAAAREMGLDKATVTRWCQKHPALLDADNRVSVAELELHRAAVVNPKLQTRTSVSEKPERPASQKPTAVKAAKARPEKSAPVADAGPSLNDHRTRKERASADNEELNLADRLRFTLRRDDVERSVANAADIMRKTSSQMVKDRAERLAKIDDVRAMERALEDMMRELMEATSKALAEATDPSSTDTEGRDAA